MHMWCAHETETEGASAPWARERGSWRALFGKGRENECHVREGERERREREREREGELCARRERGARDETDLAEGLDSGTRVCCVWVMQRVYVAT